MPSDSSPSNPEISNLSDEDRCSCGAIHHVVVGTVVIDHTAIDQLVAYGQSHRWSKPCVVMDANTEEVLGSRVITAFSNAGMRPKGFYFPERHGLLANETSVSRLESMLKPSSADAVIAVGSGVITDITRYVTHSLGRDFVSVPTAASMDGYASSVAAMEFGGMKITSSAVAPRAIFADPYVLATAPRDMTRAGIGDLLGKASAHVDWRLSHGLWGEEFCDVVERRVAEPLVEVATHIREILQQSPERVTQLFLGLVESGNAMAMMGTSRPASGCEHHASHFWDLLASMGRHQHVPHGLQVGYATHFALRLQELALGESAEAPSLPLTIGPEDEEARSWFVGHETEVDAVMEAKRAFVTAHSDAWPTSSQRWEFVRAGTAKARSIAPLVAGALLTAEIPTTPGFLELDVATLSATFRFANRIRSRYTVIDFLEGQGLLNEAVASVMAELST
jgi:glycerol-1-phosphate dehydrogenase [NAD(P)+]